jgi:hypothetical protein
MIRLGFATLDKGLPFYPSVRKRDIHVPLLPARGALIRITYGALDESLSG